MIHLELQERYDGVMSTTIMDVVVDIEDKKQLEQWLKNNYAIGKDEFFTLNNIKVLSLEQLGNELKDIL